MCAQGVTWDPVLPQVDSADSDQTGRTDHFVGFDMPWLNFHIEPTSETIAYDIVTNLHMRN